MISVTSNNTCGPAIGLRRCEISGLCAYIHRPANVQNWSLNFRIDLLRARTFGISILSRISFRSNISFVLRYVILRETPFECFAEYLNFVDFNFNDKQIDSLLDSSLKISRREEPAVFEL